jgi:putative ABC transport system permease protein
MLKNYFLTALRNFARNKSFAAINVLGLSIGISAALVIFMIVYYELSFDKFQPDRERIYRVVIDAKFNGSEGHSAGVQAPLAKAVNEEVTGVSLVVPVMQFQGDATAEVSIHMKGNKEQETFKHQPDIIFTNPDYFRMIPFKWIAGSATSSLQDPFQVVLTERRAKQYFSSLPLQQVIGQHITYNKDVTVTVSGVVKDLKENTSFTAAEFISHATISKTHLQDRFMMDVWNDWMAYSQLYLKLSKPNNAAQIEGELNRLLKKYHKNANKDAANAMAFRLQPLSDLHFNHLYNGIGQRIAHMPTLYSLLVVAAFLLICGCINFINLTTANAAQRAKEIGVRKTMGSSKKQLVLQFLGETFIFTTIAAAISFSLSPFLLKLFEDFIPQGLVFAPFQQPYIFIFLLILVIVVSFLAGLYPALVLSGYKPAYVLKGPSHVNAGETRNASVRKVLTVSQFVIAQFFVITTLMVSKQINYSINADLGFRKDGIITFESPREKGGDRSQQLLNAINSIPEVEIASRGFLSPADKGVAFTNVQYAAQPDLKANIQIRWGDPDYINVYRLKLIAGRNVVQSDTTKEFLINEKYATLLGFKTPDEAIGKYLVFSGKQVPVVGVMQNFLDQSTHAPISPVVFSAAGGSTFHIRLRTGEQSAATWQTAIGKIEKAYNALYPDEVFDYRFFDEAIASIYASEQQTATLLRWATGLAIVISCLGLLGLVMFTISSRTKEIGIRKILGATVTNIVSILSKDFLQLVLIAFIIAAPVAWLAVHKWLQDFEYRTAMSWWIFLLSAGLMLVIALITLSIHTIRAATANPVKNLRTE